MATRVDYHITNIVAITSTDEKLDLDLIKRKFLNTQYKPKSFDGLVFKISDPKVTILVNWSGKLIIVGGTSIEDTNRARDRFYFELNKLGYSPVVNDFIIKNIVLAANTGKSLDIENIFNSNNDSRLEYEPEIFPGLIFKNKKPKFGGAIFKSGKMSIAGLKAIEDIPQAIDIIQKLIKNF
jgi:transcription initiation factor TFIID TATA-box-binding protein